MDAAIHLGLAPGTGALDERLVRAAQAAERAAATGDFVRFDAVDRDTLEREVSLMGELDHALAAGEIEVHYQPKLSIAENRITGVEALVRWRHPVRGMIPPDVFIPLADMTYSQSTTFVETKRQTTTPSAKRQLRMVERTDDWLTQLLGDEMDKLPPVFAPLLPISYPTQWAYINNLEQDFAPKLSGLAVYDALGV